MTRLPLRLFEHSNFDLKSILLIVVFTFLWAKDIALAAPGETALDFLNLPVGANAAALGQGGYAGITGPEAIFGNPSLLRQTSLFACHQELLLDTQSEAMAVAADIGNGYTLGLGALIFSPGSVIGYSQDNLRTGAVDAGDRAFKLAISREGRISFGITALYYSQKLDNLTGSGFGIGGGITAETRLGRYALTADHIGPNFKIGNSSAPLPGRYSVSGWLPLLGAPADLSFDLSYRYKIGLVAGAGIEYRPLKALTIRGGVGADARFAAGLRMSMGSVAIDYAYVPSGDFGDKHIFSFVLTK